MQQTFERDPINYSNIEMKQKQISNIQNENNSTFSSKFSDFKIGSELKGFFHQEFMEKNNQSLDNT